MQHEISELENQTADLYGIFSANTFAFTGPVPASLKYDDFQNRRLQMIFGAGMARQ